MKINFKRQNNDEFETIYQSFVNEKIFRILDKEHDLNYLSLECKFDNFLPSIIITFDILYSFKDNIISIETCGCVSEFNFNTVEKFLIYMFSINKDKLLSYYRQLGYLAIDSDKYYKKRIHLKKYYKKLK